MTDKTNTMLDWRTTTFYKHTANIYLSHLGFGGSADTVPEGVKGMKEVVEPAMAVSRPRPGGRAAGSRAAGVYPRGRAAKQRCSLSFF